MSEQPRASSTATLAQFLPPTTRSVRTGSLSRAGPSTRLVLLSLTMCLISVSPYDLAETMYETDLDESKKNEHLKMPSPLCPSQPLSLTYLAPTTPRSQTVLAVEQAIPKNKDLPPESRTERLIEPSGAHYLTTLSPRWQCVHEERELMSDSLRPELISPGSSSSLSPSVGKTGT